MNTKITLLFCGDISPTTDTINLFDSARPSELMHGLVEEITKADIAFANLECVLSGKAPAIDKIGPILRGHPRHAKLLAKAGFDILGMANNHIADCGSAGVMDTLAACESAGVLSIGAGINSNVAAEPLILQRSGFIIGYIAVAEEEFNVATSTSPGANIFDALTTLEQIKKLKANCDYVVVVYHGGIEYYEYPSPLLQRKCRAMIRHGADLILCQHSHCIGAHESYEGGEILYGQGNSIFGYREGNRMWNEGLVVKVKLCRDASILHTHVDYLPLACGPDGSVDLAENEKAEICLSDFSQRSVAIQDDANVVVLWKEFCKQKAYTHIPHLLGFSKLSTRINRLLKGSILRILFSRRQKMISLNVLRCDAHREVIQTALENECKS